jgi:hypothetical protein
MGKIVRNRRHVYYIASMGNKFSLYEFLLYERGIGMN